MSDKPMWVVKRVKEKLKQGLFLRYLFDRLAAIGFEITPYYLVEEGLSGEAEFDLNPKLAQYVPGFLEPMDMKIISAKSGVDYSEEMLLDRIVNGCRCFAIKHNNDILAYSWCNLRECHFKLLPFRLKNDEAYLFDARTLEPHRGKALAPYLRYQLYKRLMQIGKTKFFSITHLFNTPAIKFKKKLNAKPLRFYLYIELFRKYHWNILLRNYEKPHGS
jgi:hypothetical protein